MTKKISILFGLLLCLTVTAQTEKETSLENLIPGGDDYLYTETIYGLQWWGDMCIKPETDKLVIINPKNGEQSTHATLDEVNQILIKENFQKLTSLYSISFPWPEQYSILLQQSTEYIKVDLVNRSAFVIQDFDKKAENKDFHAKSNNLAYTLGNNLYVNKTPISNNPDGVVSGQTVHRSEFGINKGTFWSPSGSLLAFYQMDERMVTNYPLVNISKRTATADFVRYPMAGMDSHLVSIGIYNPTTESTLFLNTGDPTNRFFTNISWAPNEKSIYLIEVNREQNEAKLCQYSTESGELIATLLTEKHSKYVEPQSPIQFLPWDSSLFIYQSEKDGFNHLYLYNTKGQLKSQLTKGEWVVQSVLGFNSKQKKVYLTATNISPLQSNILSLSVHNRKIQSLDNELGVHRPKLSHSGNYLIDEFSTPETPKQIDLVITKNGKRKNILTAKNPYKGYKQPSIETGTIKAADGITDLYYRLTKPSHIKENTKYPTVIYVYGGPHAQMIDNSWNYGARGWDIYMANKGYIVFSLDNRGSDNRGFEFESVTFRELGIKEGEDQVEGVKFLQSLPYVDTNRIGVHGWSFGGHMTTALMLRYPDLFKVGVAGGPVINWEYYEIMYGERYMDSPQSNPEGYKKTNLCNYANLLKGKLLLIHDGHDSVCVPQHTYSFIKACIDARTYPDLFIYPGHEHNVIGRDRVHLYKKITQYFENNL